MLNICKDLFTHLTPSGNFFMLNWNHNNSNLNWSNRFQRCLTEREGNRILIRWMNEYWNLYIVVSVLSRFQEPIISQHTDLRAVNTPNINVIPIKTFELYEHVSIDSASWFYDCTKCSFHTSARILFIENLFWIFEIDTSMSFIIRYQNCFFFRPSLCFYVFWGLMIVWIDRVWMNFSFNLFLPNAYLTFAWNIAMIKITRMSWLFIK